MNCLISLLICITSFFTVVTLNDVDNIKHYLIFLQNNSDILSRKVFIDGNEISVNDVFQLFNTAGMEINWLINEENVYSISYMLNTVMSCEFSDITYFFVKLIDLLFKHCWSMEKSNLQKLINCFKHINKYLFQSIFEYIHQMILTLVKLVKYAKTIISSKLDILKNLLSWDLHIENVFENISVVETFETIENRFDYMEIINYQMQKHLERFSIKNCQPLEKYKNFQVDIDSTLKITRSAIELVSYDDMYIYKIIVDKYDRIKLLTYIILHSQQDNIPIFVKNFKCVPEILTHIMPYINLRKIQVMWNGRTHSLFHVFNIYCNKLTKKNNIEDLLKYEKIFIEILTKIIIDLTLAKLENIIMNNYRILYKKEPCKALLNKLNSFTTKIISDGQSLYLANNMLILQNKLNIICTHYMKPFNEESTFKINKIINELKGFQIENFISIIISNDLSTGSILKNLLLSLSSTLIFIAIHPIISNLFWEKMSFVSSSNISNFVVDYANLETKNKNNQYLCDKAAEISKKLNVIKNNIELCDKHVAARYNYYSIGKTNIQNDKLVDSCFKTFNEHWKKLKHFINDVVQKNEQDDNVKLNTILLIIIYNMDNVELFNFNVQQSINNQGIKNLIKFHHDINILMDVYTHITCPRHDFKLNIFPKFMGKINLSISNSKPKLNNDLSIRLINAYKNFFSFFRDFVIQVMSYEEQIEKYNLNIKMYWNGAEKTVFDIYSDYKMNTIEIQDSYDYMNFTIKWFIAVVYSNILYILKKIISGKYQPATNELDELLKQSLNCYMQLTLVKFVPRPVQDIIEMFMDVIVLFDNENVDMLIDYETKLNNELDYLGIIPNSLSKITNNDDSLIEHIYAFQGVIYFLNTIFQEFKPIVTQILHNIDVIENKINLFMFSETKIEISDQEPKSVKWALDLSKIHTFVPENNTSTDNDIHSCEC